MEQTIDCRGMACPLPVINAKKAIEAFTGDGTLNIKVDNETAVQNLIRLGEHNGFKVASPREGERAFTVTMAVTVGKGQPADVPAEAVSCREHAAGGKEVVLSGDTMGLGAAKLGKKLMKAFIFALTSQDEIPDKVICYNTGARLTTLDADTVKDLKTLEAAGTTVMTCGTCLDFYGLKEQLQVGIVSNMYDIVEAQMSAALVIRP